MKPQSQAVSSEPSPRVLIVANCDHLSPCENEVLALTEQLSCQVENFTSIDELPKFHGQDTSHLKVEIHWSVFTRHMLGSLGEVQARIERTHGIPASRIQAFGTRFAAVHTKPSAARLLATT